MLQVSTLPSALHEASDISQQRYPTIGCSNHLGAGCPEDRSLEDWVIILSSSEDTLKLQYSHQDVAQGTACLVATRSRGTIMSGFRAVTNLVYPQNTCAGLIQLSTASQEMGRERPRCVDRSSESSWEGRCLCRINICSLQLLTRASIRRSERWHDVLG
jgi:hypothetical protein